MWNALPMPLPVSPERSMGTPVSSLVEGAMGQATTEPFLRRERKMTATSPTGRPFMSS
jgi:hypothetical protein